MSSFNLVLDAPVTVEWEEANNRFAGTVKSVNEDGSCDVLYNEQVGGKPCLERNVQAHRIEISQSPGSSGRGEDRCDDDYWEESDKSSKRQSRKRNLKGLTDSDGLAASRSNTGSAADGFVHSLLQALMDGKSLADSATTHELNNMDMRAVHDVLTPQLVRRLMSEGEVAGANASLLSALLSARIQSACAAEHTPRSVADQWSAFAGENNTKQMLREWVDTMASEDDSALNTAAAVHCGIAALLRLHSAQVRQQNTSAALSHDPSGGIDMSEETLERSLRYGNAFLQTNFLSSAAAAANAAWDTKGASAVNSASSAKGKKGGKENILGRAVSEMAALVFPTLTSVLAALCESLALTRPAQRIIASALELALSALRCDPVSCPVLETLQVQHHAVLVALHKSAAALVAQVFTLYASQRKGILLELLGMLNQTYTAKAPYRSYALQGGTSQEEGGGRHTSVVLATLLMCAQGGVSLQDALPEAVSNAAFLPVNTTAAESRDEDGQDRGDKGKGKAKGKKGKSAKSDGRMSPVEAAKEEQGPANPAAAAARAKESARRGIYPVYACCSMFVTELFQRCTHKDVCTEYRALCSSLVAELLAILQLPAFPAAAVLLEQTVLAVLKHLTPGDNPSAKRDTAFTVYLLDLLGAVCVGMRSVMVTAEREERAAEAFQLSPEVQDSLSRKVAELKQGWLATAKSRTSSQSSAAGKKSAKQNPPAALATLDVATALSALLEITSCTVDALLEQPRSEGLGEDGDGPSYSSSLSTLPPPVAILQQLPQHADLLDRFPVLSPVDLQYYHICAYLSAQECPDAYAATIALWYVSATSDDRTEVAEYVGKLLEGHLLKQKQAAGRVGRGHTAVEVPAVSFADADNATRGSYSIEAVLSANRAVLCARCLTSIFERVLSEILALSMETQPTVRAKVIKVLSPLLQCDNDLIQRDNIREVITSRLYDRAISVREESVKLLGYYVVKGYANLSEAYLVGLQERLDDEGISVRKSVVLLFKEILLNQPNHPQYVALCQALLQKASHPKEEESIREIIRLTFQQIWFLPPSAAVVQTSQRLRASAVKQGSSDNLSLANVESCGSLTLQFAAIGNADDSPATPSVRGDATPVAVTGGLTRSQSLPSVAASSPASPAPLKIDTGVPNHPYHVSSRGGSACSPRTESVDPALMPPPTLLRRTSSERVENAATTPVKNTTPRVPASAVSRASSADFSVSSANGGGARSGGMRSLGSPKIALRDHIRATALQLVDLAAMDGAADWMVSLLRELLHGSSDGDDTAAQVKQRRAGSFKYCEQIVSCLVELLLCTEEQQPEIMQLLAQKKRDVKTQATNLIRTIALFCQAHPPFIARHLNTLLPYLKQDNAYTREQNAQITLNVTEILSHTALLDSSCFAFDLTAVVADLKRCALNQSGKNIKAAINCLAILAANVTHDASPLFQLAETCFRGTKSIASAIPDPAQLNAGHIGNLQRLLIVFGYICECARKCPAALLQLGKECSASLSPAMRRIISAGKPDREVAMKDISEIEALHPSILYGACYSAAVYALTVQVPAVQVRGAQALCGVFSGCPRLMLLAQEEGLLGALLGRDYNDAVHERFLVALKEMMTVEEERLESEQALKLMKDSGVAVIERDAVMSNPAIDAESTIPGFALQQHIAALTGFLSHPSANLRHATLQLVGTLLRQGMLSPLDAIASLIAMQGDSDQRIRDEALTMLQVVDERHPTFLGNRMLDGIELSFSFQRAALGSASATLRSAADADPLTEDDRVSIFAGFYSTCVQHPKRRKELLDGLLGRCYNLLTKLRETVAQSAGSYDQVLQEQAQQRASQEQEQLLQAGAVANAQDNSADTAAMAEAPQAPSAASPRGLVRRPSFPQSPGRAAAALEPSRLVQILEEAFSKPAVGDFLTAVLAYLPYEVIEEPLKVIYYINRNVTVGTSLLLYRLKQQLLVMGGELRKPGAMQPPALGSRPKGSKIAPKAASAESTADWEQELVLSEAAFAAWLAECGSATTACLRMCEVLLLALQLRCYEAILRLKSFQKSAYSLSDERCLAFTPDSTTATSASSALAAGDKLCMNEVAAYQAQSSRATDLAGILSAAELPGAVTRALARGGDACPLMALMRAAAADYNRVNHVLNEDPADFALTSGTGATAGRGKGRRKLPTASASVAAAKPGAKRGRPHAAGKEEKEKVKKKARRVASASSGGDSSDEDAMAYEDDPEDDDWEG